MKPGDRAFGNGTLNQVPSTRGIEHQIKNGMCECNHKPAVTLQSDDRDDERDVLNPTSPAQVQKSPY
jgi:hypothetical protein